MSDSTIPWTAARQSSLSITNSWSLLKFMSIESGIPSNCLHPLSSPSPPAFNPSQYQALFQWISSLHQVAKVLEFQLRQQSFQWIFRMISFTIDWFDLFAVQGTLRVFSSTTVWKHYFFGTQPSLWSNSHIHTWPLEKPQLWLYGLCQQSNVSVFKMLSKFVIAFLPRSNCLLISWLQSPSPVILEPKKIKINY